MGGAAIVGGRENPKIEDASEAVAMGRGVQAAKCHGSDELHSMPSLSRSNTVPLQTRRKMTSGENGASRVRRKG